MPRRASLPSLDGRRVSLAFEDTADTRLGKAVLPLVQVHPDTSGFFPLPDGREAFATRVLMAEAAERSLDIQYYIWRRDQSGSLLLDAIVRAADRGVRVRLLLDDDYTRGMDDVLAALDTHPNVEVRLFNPFVFRRWRLVGYLTDFSRLIRRMHNKSFTADDLATIIGGRNVGNEYFGAGQGLAFADLDVLAIGPVVKEVSKTFDRYWASDSSYPAERVLAPVGPEKMAVVAAATARLTDDPLAIVYTETIAGLPYVRQVLAGELPFEWATARMFSDDPAKALGRAAHDEVLWQQLRVAFQAPTRELHLVSPYFVPGATRVEYFSALAKRGVKTAVLTNSLEATDIPVIHAGYVRSRKRLLEAGVVLFELKREFAANPAANPGGARRPTGRSNALHAKTLSLDRTQVFIGSSNFDPRSERLNTEMGFLIHSEVFGQAIADAFTRSIPARSYEVRLNDAGTMQWVEQRDGAEVVHEQEPGTSVWLRAFVYVMSTLPIQWLL